MKTDNEKLVGVHQFEAAGMGKAPFKFVGMTENMYGSGGDAKPGGTCDYCGNGIRYEFWIRSSDGQRRKVGSNCIDKVGDKGLIKAYKQSPEFRARQREARRARGLRDREELKSLAGSNQTLLKDSPHPFGRVDWKSGSPLTFLDFVEWYINNAGDRGIHEALSLTKRFLDRSNTPSDQ